MLCCNCLVVPGLVRRFRVGRLGVGRFVAGIGGLGVSRLVLWVLGFTLVRNIGDVSVLVGLVVDSLHATIGQEDVIAPGLGVTIAGLLMTKVVVGVVIFDSVGKVVRNGSLNGMNHFKLLGLSS